MSERDKIEDEDDYRESEDEDFNPEDDALSEDEDETKEEKEQIKNYDALQGDGGAVKTRAQRDREALEGKKYKQAEKSTANVDAIWASMNSKPASSEKPAEELDAKSVVGNPVESSKDADEYITIKRTYRFAGKVTTEEKRVLKSSAEAKAYLAQQKNPDQIPVEAAAASATSSPSDSIPTTTKAPLRKVKRKRAGGLEAELAGGKPKKMNTLEKSRLDWAGFVDREGIAEDLTHHNKGGYLIKQDFLNKVDHRLDQNWKAGQKKN